MLLLVCLFLVDWFGVPRTVQTPTGAVARTATQTGWESLSHLRWMLLLAGVLGLCLLLAQATRPAPAIPVALSVIVSVVGLLATLWLIYRVLISAAGTRQAGGYVGLAATAGVAIGGYLSLRREGIAEADGPVAIETVRLPSRERPDRA